MRNYQTQRNLQTPPKKLAPIDEEEWEADYQLPADGTVDDEGSFEVRRDWYNDNLCLK